MTIELIYEPEKIKKLALSSIKAYGFGPEHNLSHYFNLQEHGKKNVFVSFGSQMGILAQVDSKNEWYTVDDVLAPEELRINLFIEFANYVFFEMKAKKIITETSPEFRKRLMGALKKNCSFPKIRYPLFWPVISLENWDNEIKGKNWKKIRNLKHRIYKSYDVKVCDTKTIDKGELKQLVLQWIKKRAFRDQVEKERYFNLIDCGFEGCDYARSIILNGKVATISAGWKIPNSKGVYSAIGILNYREAGLGEAAYLDELNFLKEKGYLEANFGGSDEAMLFFKKKFKPYRIYETDVYSIIKK